MRASAAATASAAARFASYCAPLCGDAVSAKGRLELGGPCSGRMTACPPTGGDSGRILPGAYAGGGAEGGPGGGAVGPGGGWAGTAERPTSGAPQATQKRLAGSFIAPHRWHWLMKRALGLGIRPHAV